ncbi:hypothetical protein P7C73_g3064, partial [Tremellales sp. Uapishka_1]
MSHTPDTPDYDPDYEDPMSMGVILERPTGVSNHVGESATPIKEAATTAGEEGTEENSATPPDGSTSVLDGNTASAEPGDEEEAQGAEG